MQYSHHTTRGRLAPSPTGLLHLGNAWAFWLAWMGVRARHGWLVLRMEDIDPDRAKPDFAAAIVHDLHWLGLDWDAGPGTTATHGTDGFSCVQSERLPLYEAALAQLQASGHVYPCYCTRKELRQLAGAPHVDDAGAPYPGICRQLSSAQRAALEAQGRRPALRLRCPQADGEKGTLGEHEEGRIHFEDLVCGAQSMTLTQCGGDFALRRSDNVLAYQLAVVVDDAAMDITHVVRGQDILVSTPRQWWLQHLLGLPHPHYAHIPLLLDEEGQRLAKRHHSLSLRALREQGVDPQRVLGLLAHLARMEPCRETPQPCPAPLLVHEVQKAGGVDWKALPTEALRVTKEHLAWLCNAS